jgi:hypothetical protein
MLTLVQRNALESVEAPAKSTSTAPVTTPPSNTTTPLTTVQPTATAVSMIEPRIKPHPTIDKLIKLNTSESGQPFEVSASDLCASTGVTYIKFNILLNRQFTVQQAKRSDENNPSSDHNVRHH